MPDQFAVTATWDKTSYRTGDTITATISGNDVQTVTQTTTSTIGPVTIPVIAANGATSTVDVPAVEVAVTETVTTPQSVLIDTSRSVTDNGPAPRKWAVSADKLSIASTA